MRHSHYSVDLLKVEAADRMDGFHQWADNERLAQQMQRPSQLSVVRLALVLIAASVILALLMVGI